MQTPGDTLFYRTPCRRAGELGGHAARQSLNVIEPWNQASGDIAANRCDE